MPKAIRLDCTQQMPNYRKPASFLIRESYPLPPYSSVIGMVHAVCGFKEYHGMKVSVQGEYSSTVSDLNIIYTFSDRYDKDRTDKYFRIVYKEDGKPNGIYRGPMYAELLTDVNLVLHIQPLNPADFDMVLNSLRDPAVYPALGRHEDLLQIDRVKVVELTQTDNGVLKYDAYIPLDQLDPYTNEAIKGTVYRINKQFTYKKGLRVWEETVLVRHVSKDSLVLSDKMFVDNDDIKPVAVFLA